MADSAPIVLDHSHELFLRPLGHPNCSLASDPLTRSNYAQWKRSCEVSLVSKHKFGFVNGSYPKPATGSLISKWERCNAMVISWLLHVFIRSEKILLSVFFSAQLPSKFGMSLSCVTARANTLKSFRSRGRLIIFLKEVFLFQNISLCAKYYGMNIMHLFIFQLVLTLNVLLVLLLSNYLRINS